MNSMNSLHRFRPLSHSPSRSNNRVDIVRGFRHEKGFILWRNHPRNIVVGEWKVSTFGSLTFDYTRSDSFLVSRFNSRTGRARIGNEKWYVVRSNKGGVNVWEYTIIGRCHLLNSMVIAERWVLHQTPRYRNRSGTSSLCVSEFKVGSKVGYKLVQGVY